jgi:hypothetical protein
MPPCERHRIESAKAHGRTRPHNHGHDPARAHTTTTGCSHAETYSEQNPNRWTIIVTIDVLLAKVVNASRSAALMRSARSARSPCAAEGCDARCGPRDHQSKLTLFCFGFFYGHRAEQRALSLRRRSALLRADADPRRMRASDRSSMLDHRRARASAETATFLGFTVRAVQRAPHLG